MTTLEALLSSRASFVLAALVVTWAAILCLAVIAGHLHARLQRLERAAAASTTRAAAPYGELIGMRLDELGDLLGDALRHAGTAAGPVPRLVLFVSSTCRVCANLLDELKTPAWTRLPSAIVLTDRDNGPALSAKLGIRVTPFALLAAADGTVVHAAPVNTLRSLEALLRAAPSASSIHVPGHLSQEVARESRV